MCSTDSQRVTEIGKAIDDLAARLGTDPALASARPGSARQAGDAAGVSEADQIVIRLAQLWAQLAELDPEVAKRLPRYQA